MQLRVHLTHYYVEKEYTSIDEGMTATRGSGIREVAEQIQELGTGHCVMATDFGCYALSTPIEGLPQFITCMVDLGLTAVKTNPEWLLGLEPLEETTSASCCCED